MPLTPERWDRVKRLCQAALELSPEDRSVFIDAACGADVDLRNEVASMLAARTADDNVTPKPALPGDAAVIPNVLRLQSTDTLRTSKIVEFLGARGISEAYRTLTAGQQLGPYYIERLLGKGGMGEVYAAEDTRSGRRVALKVLNSAMTSEANLARFLREGRLAASVNHPNSVYVFGCEEIDNQPVIAMELVGGGTLKDLVRTKGHLDPTTAVDAILQIIAGLEAAADVGVLHRDVKPTNCFVGVDGTIKVGDFGLSISTLSRDVTRLTLSRGRVLGTPEFASPEQLRGDPLEVRSDIYSVGATLHYLLTGHVLFAEPDIVKLVAAVLERAPRSARELQSEVPRELAKVVLRCVAKRPDDRYDSYEALRKALLPFSSTKAAPAPIGTRVLAGFVDAAIVFVPTVKFLEWWTYDVGGLGLPTSRPSDALFSLFAALGPGHTFPFFYITPVLSIVPLVYFSVLEGVWGLTVGKWLCGVRVVRVPGHRPGVLRAIARVLIVLSVLFVVCRIFFPPFLALLFALIALPIEGVAAFGNPVPVPPEGIVLSAVMVAAFGPFLRARVTNGYMALQDWLTGTRVILASHVRRPHATRATTPTTRSTQGSIGPYALVESLYTTTEGELVLAYDQRLRRDVWIYRQRVGAPLVPTARRDLNRPGRLRWLNGGRFEHEQWDAYEALNGEPIATARGRRHSWQTVRTWLTDLAAEIPTLIETAPTVALSVNRVWIASDGHAKYLDFDLVTNPSVETFPMDMAGAQTFLAAIAKATVDPTSPPSLRTQTFLRSLEARRIGNPDTLAAEARLVASGPATVSPTRRFVHLCVALIGTLSVSGIATQQFVVRIRPDLSRLKLSMSELTRIERGGRPLSGSRAENVQAWQMYIAGRFYSTIENQRLWSTLQARTDLSSPFIPPQPVGNQRALAERIVSNHPNLPAHDLDRARGILDRDYAFSIIEGRVPGFTEAANRSPRGRAFSRFLFSSAVSPPEGIRVLMGLFALAIVGMISAAAFRGSILLRVLGLAVVTRHGLEASRVRALWRAIVAWAPAIVFFLAWTSPYLNPFASSTAATVVLFGAVAVGAVWAIVTPSRGLQDRLAGTWLVPR